MTGLRQEPPSSDRCVALFFDAGHWCEAFWSGAAWRPEDARGTRGGFGTDAAHIIGWMPLSEAIVLAKKRRAEYEARRAAA